MPIPDCSSSPEIGSPCDDWPYGYGMCHCGCGERTNLWANATDRRRNRFRGRPMRFLSGHNVRKGVGRNAVEKFWSRVDRTGGAAACWPWTGGQGTGGYGHCWNVVGNEKFTHRTAWLLTNGPIPPGEFVCHICDNPPCCNPAHLFVGTNEDNSADRDAKGRGSPPPPGQKRGEAHHRAKLTEAKVRDIRQRWDKRESCRALAEEYGVDVSMIYYIAKRKNWRHVA